MGKVLVEGMVIYANHGLFEEEQQIGRKFIVDVSIETDLSAAAKTDEIKGTVNYAEVARIVKQQMATPSRLLEHVGQRIIDAIRKEMTDIQAIQVKIAKTNPPVPGQVDKVCIVVVEPNLR